MTHVTSGGVSCAAAILGVLLTLTPTASAAPPEKTHSVEGIDEYRLANGLRVLLFPDDSTPKVTVNLTVFVGSRHEGYGETGMAHLLEHMLFKGTPTHPDVPKALRDHGANFNGTTWVDRTNYFETMPATDENLEFGIRLEADRMVNSFVKREDLLSEMTVVRNEFERGENDPERVLSQRMMATAYEWHNYGKSTIGNRSDIERVPIENLQAFYKKFYRPDNAMLVIAGKFDPAKALEYVEKYFGPVKNPPGKLSNTYTEEPAQDGERFVTLRRVGTVGVVGAIYHVPAGPHPDFPAVQVLANVLLSEPAGRLYQALVVPKLATSVSGLAYNWHDPGVIEITAQCEPAKLDAVREKLVETLEKLHTTKITPEEVERAKLQMLRRNEQLLHDPNRLAIQLSEWASKGDWRLFFVNRDRTEKVTPDEVARAAEKYLTAANRTLGVYVPTDKAQRAEVPPAPDVASLVNGYKGRAAVTAGETFDPTPEAIEKRVVRGEVGGVKTALLAKKTRGETVRLRLTLRFGSAESLMGHTTACELLGEMLERGTKRHDRQQIRDELEKLAARLSVSSDVGSLTVTLEARRPNLEKTLALVGEILREPSFPATELELLKREQREQLDKALTEPTALASRLLQQKLSPFPKSSIRHVPSYQEEIEQLGAVTIDELRSLYEKQLGGQAGELAVVGDFDADALTKQVGEVLGGWSASVPYKRIERPAKEGVAGERLTIRTPDKANAFYLAGQVFGMDDADPAYAPIEVGNFVLGAAPLASRLSNRVRGKEGLSYGVRSQFGASSKDKAARYMIYAITNPANIKKVDKAILEEVEKFLAEGPSEKELGEGKKAYLEQLKVQRADDGQLAATLAGNLYAGRTMKYQAELEGRIADLTASAVTEAFRKYVTPKGLVIIEAGDFKK